LKKAGLNQTEIAVIISINKRTEVSLRNSGLRGYRSQQAHTLTLGRRASNVPTHWRQHLAMDQAIAAQKIEP